MMNPIIWVEWKDGKGIVMNYAPAGPKRKIHAIILVNDKLVAVPIGDLRVIRAPRKKKR